MSRGWLNTTDGRPVLWWMAPSVPRGTGTQEIYALDLEAPYLAFEPWIPKSRLVVQ